ncbi:MAG: hypothetical protein ACRD1Z_15635, partial [Vicinamibacteria bacterium]
RPVIKGGILFTIVFLLQFTAGTIASIPAWILMFWYQSKRGLANPHAVATLPPAVQIPLEMVNLLVSTIALPFATLSLVLLYYDIRIRNEGFDLEMMAQNLGRGAP